MAKTYDLKSVICIVGGATRIQGFGESDAIGIEWDEDTVTNTVTADGDHIYSRNNNRGMTVTITLSQKSRSHLFLAQLYETQHGEVIGVGPPLILPNPFYLLDPATGETINSADAVFMTRPASSKGKTVGEVQYKLHLPNPRVTPALANLI